MKSCFSFIYSHFRSWSYVGLLLCDFTFTAIAQTAINHTLQLSGSQFVTVPAANLSETTGFVVEAWVKPSEAGFLTIASRGGGSSPTSNTDWIMQVTPTAQLAFFYNGAWQYSAIDAVPVGRWTHVAVEFFTVPGNTTEAIKQLWINGIAHGLPARSFNLPSALLNTEAMFVGRQGSACACNPFRGEIDELRIWRRENWAALAVRPDTSRRLFPANTIGLLASYRFDESSGLNVTDSSGAGRDGMLSALPARPASIVPYEPSLVITGLGDAINNQDGQTTLREAVAYANAIGTPQTITFSNNDEHGALNFHDGTIRSTQIPFEIPITSPLTIIGPGANRLEVFAQLNTRHFHISGFGAKTISGLLLTGGRISTPNVGGSILQTNGTLTLNQCAFGDNRSPNGIDGCIHVKDGILTLNRCTFVFNTAGAGSGALHATSTASGSTAVTLNQCTLSGNLINDEGSPNPPQNGVGGILATGSNTIVTLNHCTLSGNIGSAANEGNPFAGGIEVSGATVNLTNTIVANSTGDDVRATGVNSTINFSGKNVIESGTASTNILVGDPQLGELAFNGGPTATHALLLSSSAIDAGDSFFATSFNSDQRGTGFLRLIGPHVDIGAYEFPGTSDFAAWRQLHNLASDGSQDLQNPSNDGVVNLLKYAFNLAPNFGNLNLPNVAILPPNGAAGLPNISRDSSGLLSITFLRRKASRNPGLNYIVETGSTLTDFAPLSLTGSSVSSVSTLFERVIVTDPSVSSKRFGRVRVEKITP